MVHVLYVAMQSMSNTEAFLKTLATELFADVA